MTEDSLPDHVRKNRELWDHDAEDWVAAGERNWAGEPVWGIWGIPETELRLLPGDMSGLRSVELGCGTGYVSAWMARRGGTVCGIDNSERQLETARRLAAQHGVDLELVHGNAERTPWAGESFDFAISEYGAATWCDPKAWIPEAHRLLRPGGELVFLGNHPLATLAMDAESAAPAGRSLRRPYFGLHRVDWSEPGGATGTEFNLPISGWLELFRETGFELIAYRELRAPAGRDETRFGISRAWARDYPSEQVLKLRKRMQA